MARGLRIGHPRHYRSIPEAGSYAYTGQAVSLVRAGGPDVTAPTVPGTPVITTLSDTALGVAWAASTDAVGVTQYEVQRRVGAAAFATVGTSATNNLTDVGLTASTTYDYRVRAKDAANNASAYSSTGSGSTAVGSSMMWEPGFYVGDGTVLTQLSGSSLTNKMNEIKTNIDRHCSNSTVKGFHFRVTWAHLEPTKNAYNFTQLDELVAYMNANHPGKFWGLEIWAVKFANNPSGYIPPYLSSEPDSAGGWYYDGSAGTKATIYKASVMAREIALFQAFAAHYSSDPSWAFIHTGESTFAFNGASGWSQANEQAQMFLFYEALGTLSTVAQRPIFAQINYFLTESRTEQLFAKAALEGLGVSGPDTLGYSYQGANPTYVWGQAILRGKTWNGSAWVNGGTDYRGVIPVAYQVQEPEMLGYQFGGQGAPFTCSDILQTSHDVLYNNFTAVNLCSYAYGANVPAYTISNSWFAQIQSEGRVTRTTLPSIYT